MTDKPVPSPADGDGDDPRADLRWGTIANAVVDAVARGGDREALVDGERSWTWAEVGAEVGRARGRMLCEAPSGLESESFSQAFRHADL